jgi:hypothetical protein
VEAPPHRAEFWFSFLPRCPLPASGARDAALWATVSNGASGLPHRGPPLVLFPVVYNLNKRSAAASTNITEIES